jgi:hypothetical protein
MAVYGARCPVHRLLVSAPWPTEEGALDALLQGHSDHLGVELERREDWIMCWRVWEVVRVETEPPYGDHTYQPFKPIRREVMPCAELPVDL